MKSKITLGWILCRLLIILLLVTTFYPLVTMLVMSLKPNVLINTDFLALPKTLYLQNYAAAWDFVKRPILNSFLVCGGSLVGILIDAALAGYAFSRMQFKGKNILYMLLLAVMMVPATIEIVPQYLIMAKFKLLNSYWALILPYIASQQVIGIILVRTAFDQMPGELFDAAKIDGAGDVGTLLRIGLPLLKPTLVTVGITAVVAMYNDYIWPTIVLTGGDEIKTFCQIVYNNTQGFIRTDYGMMTAAFVLGSIPLVIITCSCLKYYLAGLVAGSVKG